MNDETAVLESGIPIPSISQTRSFGQFISPSKTMRKMKAGDSFVVDSEADRNRILVVANEIGIEVTSRPIEEGRYRIWRKK